MTRQISLEEVRKHNTSRSVWMVIHDEVYDVTKFLNEHPGGTDTLLDVAGQDGTEPFEDVGHSEDAREILKKFKIGILPPSEKNQVLADCCKRNIRKKKSSCPSLPKLENPEKTWRTFDGGSSSSRLKWALLALAGAIIIGIVIKKYSS